MHVLCALQYVRMKFNKMHEENLPRIDGFHTPFFSLIVGIYLLKNLILSNEIL
jgi:hypothetical protein